MALLLAAKVSDLVARPGAAAAFAIIEVSAVWALGAALAWTVRVLALSSCGAWGARTRRRREDAGRRGSGSMAALSYPRRQRYRRLARAARLAALAFGSLLMAAAAANAGLTTVSLALVLVAVAAGSRAGRWITLARRSAIGARSEDLVRNHLRALEREGWQVHNSLRWTGGGDIDHIAVAPQSVGLTFALETKTRTYTGQDVARIYSVAAWLVRRRASSCREGAIPILCLARARDVERWEGGVAVVSVDRLVPLLRRLSGTTPKPGFLG